MSNVFISYVRENAALVDRLAGELQAHGVTVWLDRDKIMPGQFWQDAIRQAIREGDYFIACFSAEYVARRQSYMNTEIGLAIEILQEMPADRIWFIPVLLSECEIPDRSIGGGQTLRDLQWEPLYNDWARSACRILKAMGVERRETIEPARPDLLIIDKPLRLELVRVPAGEFLMGTRTEDITGLMKVYGGEPVRYETETPQHRLALPEFYIGKYPVTNEQYALFWEQGRGTAPGPRQAWKIRSMREWEPEAPVVRVSWHDARAFCQWMSQATGRAFRLPSEAEWEKAARGMDGRVYPWGNQAATAELCNFNNSDGLSTPVKLHPKGASPNGALGMSGNVFEWTSSLIKPYPYQATDGREDESGSDGRVVRGGSYIIDARGVRCAYRVSNLPYDRVGDIGFRVMCVSASSCL